MSNVPKIRFKGYTDAWVQRKLGALTDFYSGLTYSPENVIESGGTFVLRSSNVKDGEIVDADNVYVDSAVVNCHNVEKDDVVVVVRNGSRSLIGKHAQIKSDMANTVIGAFMTGLRSKQPSLINALLDTTQFEIEITKNLGATINQITTGAFKQMIFTIPTETTEQTAIGDFFCTLDAAIALCQRKLDGLRELKKGYLQQMFPQAEQREPRMRFAGFSGEWQKQRLGDVVKVNSGKDYKHLNYGDIPVFGTGGYMLSVDESLSSCDAVGIGRKGTIDKPQLLKAPFWTVDTLFFMTPLHNNKLLFLYALSQIIEWTKLDESTGVPSLSKINIENIEICVPDVDEQAKIGNLFHILDSQITDKQTKLVQMNKLKTAYLSKMFI